MRECVTPGFCRGLCVGDHQVRRGVQAEDYPAERKGDNRAHQERYLSDISGQKSNGAISQSRPRTLVCRDGAKFGMILLLPIQEEQTELIVRIGLKSSDRPGLPRTAEIGGRDRHPTMPATRQCRGCLGPRVTQSCPSSNSRTFD